MHANDASLKGGFGKTDWTDLVRQKGLGSRLRLHQIRLQQTFNLLWKLMLPLPEGLNPGKRFDGGPLIKTTGGGAED